MHHCRFPHIVVRSGYGVYREEVRIRRWDEPDRFESGLWQHYSHLIPLEINDSVSPDRNITAATMDGYVVAAGTQCRFKGFDSDGDVVLMAAGTIVIVFEEDFLHFDIH